MEAAPSFKVKFCTEMAKKRLPKTNAMRELERSGVAFEVSIYDPDDERLSGDYGVGVASLLGQDPDATFKTLVTHDVADEIVVCCVPVASELDLKAAAAAAGRKSLSMLALADLEARTGYVRGGCTPVGMKSRFPVLIDETAQLFDTINISGGMRGVSLTLDPEELASFAGAKFADICREV